MKERPIRLRAGELIDQYRNSFAQHGDSPAAVLWPRGRQALRFDALTKHIRVDGFSVLDFGCGLGHLKPYLDKRFSSYTYRGVDIVPEFATAVARKYPDCQTRLINSHEDLAEAADHIVISGAFNIIQGDSAGEYLGYVQNVLSHLFTLCRISLSVNFMTDQVDFVQPGAHHVNVENMYRYVRDRLSSRLLLDQTYMPYEFTLVAFKNNAITRPDNIYGPL